MLNVFVGLYLLVSIGIGLYAARRVQSSQDYVVAGRSLPAHPSCCKDRSAGSGSRGGAVKIKLEVGAA